MSKKHHFSYHIVFFVIFCVATLGIMACNESDSSGDSASGTLSVGLTDAASDLYDAVYVTIDQVQAHKQNESWKTVATPQKTYNLLALVNGKTEPLGNSTLSAGTYTQIRLILGDTPDNSTNINGKTHNYANYLIPKGPTSQKELKVPSGLQTGIKLVSTFTVQAAQVTDLVLDFDADKSVVQAGSSGNWLLKPTIRVLDVNNRAIVQGQIDSTVENTDMNGTRVTVQKLDAVAEKETNKIQVRGGTLAAPVENSTNATYTMLTDPGQQNLVAIKNGFLPGVYAINPSVNATLTRNFTLHNATMGYINGTVTMYNDLMDDQHVALSFRHQAEYIDANSTAWIEVHNLQQTDGVPNNGNFTWAFNATLPDMSASPGDYRVVATLIKDSDDKGQAISSIEDEQVHNATLGQELTFELGSATP